MANSPSHQFGQKIGDFLEEFVGVVLRDFVVKHPSLCLDKKNNSRPARTGKKISWSDDKNNIHDLDFVIEKNGTDSSIGIPVAFIESAWRRYTKHSRNKAQEIQAAILPLANKYRQTNPFLGVVLAGEFTSQSLKQLQSCGFSVLYFPYDKLITVFQKVNVDIAYDEKTPDNDFAPRIRALEMLTRQQCHTIHATLKQCFRKHIADFISQLNCRFTRQVSKISVMPLFGMTHAFSSVNKALVFLESFCDVASQNNFVRYEIQVFFSNGDDMHASFEMKEDAVNFLREYVS